NWKHLADDLPAIRGGCQSRPDAEPIALAAPERHIQPMALWEVILKHKQRATPGLAHNQVLPAVVAKIARHDAAAVAVAVRAGQETDVQEVAAPDVHPRAVALIGAQVKTGFDDFPRVFHPKLFEFIVDSARHFDPAGPIPRL